MSVIRVSTEEHIVLQPWAFEKRRRWVKCTNVLKQITGDVTRASTGMFMVVRHK